MKKIIISLLFTILISCERDNSTKVREIVNLKPQVKKEKIIYVQPLGDVNQIYLNTLKSSIESFFHFKCVIKEKVNLTSDLLAASNTRYEASKILSKFKCNDNLLIITEKDIACRKGKIPEWGILGLGYRPGSTCIVSTFRMKRNVPSTTVLDRLKKVGIHEIGHNLGLDHCDNDIHCLMNDARGTVSQTDRERIWFCNKCMKQITPF